MIPTSESDRTSDSGAQAPRLRLREHKGARIALRILVAMGLLSLFTPLLPLEDPALPNLDRKLQGPGWPAFHESGHTGSSLEISGVTRLMVEGRDALFGDLRLVPVLGTDQLGRCVLSRILWGSRISLMVGLVASFISLAIGVLYGAVSGFSGGRIDGAMMRFVDMLYALPLMFIVIFVVTFLRGAQAADPDFPIGSQVVLFAVIGAVSWLIMARLVRGQVLSLKTMPFVDAARAAGARPAWILTRHLLPNAAPIIIVTLTLTIPRVILLEAFLSFLGLGVDAPDVSWGLLAQEGFDAVTAVHVSWWLILFPGLFLGLTLYALNALGDGLRDAADPLLRRTGIQLERDTAP